MSHNSYINLKINGRLFPSWLLLNFKKYKLPEVLQIDGDDPCKRKTKLELRKYQEFLSSFLDFRSPYKDILVYHGMGSGKTGSVINIYNILYNYTPGWNVFILIKASLRGSWLDELKLWLSKNEYETRFNNIRFIHYDSPFADRDFLNAIKQSDSSKKSIFIFDEVHNFINNVYNNITSKTGKRAYVIYDYIQQEKKENNDTRIILMTGTPAVNNPYEIALIFNLLRPGIFPNSEIKFRELYISNNKLRADKKNMFQRRIMGLISYYSGSSKEYFAQKKYHNIYVRMDSLQEKVYEHFEYIEDQMEKKNRNKPKGKSGKVSSTYRAFTRSSANFGFPVMSSSLTGENRPRPSNFRVSEKDSQRILEGKKEKLSKEEGDKVNYIDYEDMMKLYVKSFHKYLSDIKEKDKSSIENDIEVFKKKYDYNFSKFWKNHEKKSNLLKALYSCSCKMTNMIMNSFKSTGPVLMFSNYVRMEGLEIIKVYLKYFGFASFNSGKGKDYFRYTEFHGSISMEERNKNRKAFNNTSNTHGKLIRIILISPAGSEGISLSNVKQVHVLDPYWNEVRIHQLIARAIRQCSHADLPIKDRYVDIYRYFAVRKNGKKTADEDIDGLAKKKESLINSFLTVVKEIAVDCHLFKTHNMDGQEYKCFQFNQDSLFDKNIGPAYKKDTDYDMNLDNGLNSINSLSKKIKVKKIVAVKKIKDEFSEKINYLMDEETGIVYDYDLKFAIGKIYFDEDGIPEIKEKNIYIISEIIPIPLLKLYDEKTKY
jgi:hypothetical protein